MDGTVSATLSDCFIPVTSSAIQFFLPVWLPACLLVRNYLELPTVLNFCISDLVPFFFFAFPHVKQELIVVNAGADALFSIK